LNAFVLSAQIKLPETNPDAKSQLVIRFTDKEVLFAKGELISDVLIIKNTSNDSAKFYIDYSYPAKWKTFNKSNKLYTLAANDSIFIPVRIMHGELPKGNTKYMIGAFVFNTDGQQLGYSYFFANIHKDVRWELEVLPEKKLYFPNSTNVVDFSVYLYNTGNENQEIQLTLVNKSNYYLITDTAEKQIKKLSNTILLGTGNDTTFKYKMKYVALDKSYKMIDFESYNPFISEKSSKYSIFVNSAVPKKTEKTQFSTSKKIDFIKLANVEKVNRYNHNVIPIIVDMNIYNILDDHTLMNLMLKGQTELPNDAYLNYYSQFFFTKNFLDNSAFNNTPFYIGYFAKKYSVELGNIGYFGSKGIRGTYHINPNQNIEVHYAQSPSLIKAPERFIAGLRYDWRFKKTYNLNFSYNHIDFSKEKVSSENAEAKFRFRLLKKHSISLTMGGNRRYDYKKMDSTKVDYGYLLGVSYGSHYFQKKLNSHFNALYYSRDYQTYGIGYLNNNEKIIVSLNNDYKINKSWHTNMLNNYNRNATNIVINGKSGYYYTNFNNQLLFTNTGVSGISYTPMAFYNVIQTDTFQVHSRGLGFNTSKYDLDGNRRYFTYLRTGYTKAIHYQDKKNYFFAQFSLLAQVRTFTFQARYNYGNPLLTRYMLTSINKYPQFLSLSARYQYIFRNPRFVAQPYASFTYSNITGSNINLNPELFYFTRSGWRFRLLVDYFIGLSKKQNYGVYYNNMISNSSEEQKPNVSSNFNLTFGIKKEFGIPIPSKKVLFNTTDFVAFIDVNGNNKMDKNETPLENVVIRVGETEVITDNKGKARIENIPVGNYPYMVFSLTDLKGWFPHKEDSLKIDTKTNEMFIPFSRGVKIYGNIIMERDQYSAGAETPLDLSRIKVSVVDGKTYTTLTGADGYYEFFLPFGNYTLTMDENVLGGKYMLLQNNFQIQINDSLDNLFIPFHIVEKKRKLNIKSSNSANNNGLNNNIIQPNPNNNPPLNNLNNKPNNQTLPKDSLKNKPNNTIQPKDTSGAIVPVQSKSVFYIMAGSFKSKAYADDMVNKLKTTGFKNAMIVGKTADGLFRICYSYFDEKAKADEELDYMRKYKDSSAWILEQNTIINKYKQQSIQYDPGVIIK